MTVRAKFRVHNTQPVDTSGGHRIDMHPVYDSNPESENGKFFSFTPWGAISIGTVNPAVAAQLKPGTEVYVDFTPVETAHV